MRQSVALSYVNILPINSLSSYSGALDIPSVTADISQSSFASLSMRWSNINIPVDSWIVTLQNDELDAVEVKFYSTFLMEIKRAYNSSFSLSAKMLGKA